MIYIKSVKGTLKGGCDAELGPKTVICGRNGAGKSTIIQSLELATVGLVSDMEGREQVKQHTALARLFPDGGPLQVECSLSNGDLFSWSMEDKGKSKGFKEPVHLAPGPVRWPMQDMKVLLRSDKDVVAAWLEKQVLGELTEAELLQPLDPDVLPQVRALMKRAGKKDFMILAKAAKDEAKVLRAAATRAEKTVDAMIEGVQPPLLEETRVELEERKKELDATAGGITEAQHLAMRATVETLADRYVVALNTLGEAPPPPSSAAEAEVAAVASACSLIDQHQRAFGEAAPCWLCGEGTAEQVRTRGSLLKQAQSLLNEQYRAHWEFQKRQEELQAAERELMRVSELYKNAVVVEDTTEERNSIGAQLAADAAVQRAWRNAKAERAEAARKRVSAAALSKASKVLADAGKTLLDSKKQAYLDSVMAFLPFSEAIDVQLDAGRFGLVRDGQLHSALSGAEWSRVLLALASSTIDGSTPCVLAPEDRAWDRDTLGSVMAALSESPAQVIIMSTVTPEPIEGWTILQLE